MSRAPVFRPLTEYQISTLQALGAYRFLIVPQIARLVGGGRKHFPKYFSKHVLPGLDTARAPLIGRIRYPVSRLYGKRHDLFFLTDHGALALSEMFGRSVESYRTAAPRTAIERDFAHRVAYIDVCIGLRQWMAARPDGQILRFADYFDRAPLQRRAGAARSGFVSKTRVPIGNDGHYIEPDGITLFSDVGLKRLFAVEMHMTRPPGEIVRQLENHGHALARGALMKAYGCEKNNFVLSVHENPDTIRTAIARLQEIPSVADYLPAFAFATLDGVRDDFANAWRKIDGTPFRFFLKKDDAKPQDLSAAAVSEYHGEETI